MTLGEIALLALVTIVALYTMAGDWATIKRLGDQEKRIRRLEKAVYWQKCLNDRLLDKIVKIVRRLRHLKLW